MNKMKNLVNKNTELLYTKLIVGIFILFFSVVLYLSYYTSSSITKLNNLDQDFHSASMLILSKLNTDFVELNTKDHYEIKKNDKIKIQNLIHLQKKYDDTYYSFLYKKLEELFVKIDNNSFDDDTLNQLMILKDQIKSVHYRSHLSLSTKIISTVQNNQNITIIVGCVFLLIFFIVSIYVLKQIKYLSLEKRKFLSKIEEQNVELIKANEKISKSAEVAEQAAMTKSVFLANMSHEIRTPLNSIIGMSDLLLDSNLEQTQMNYVEILHFSSERLLEIINDILDFSKLEAGMFNIISEEFNLKVIVFKVCEVLELKFKEKKVKLRCEIDIEGHEIFFGDPNRIGQILFNLVGNSLKFTDQGHVKLKVARDPGKDGNILFSVEDTGIGIPSTELESVFERFSQVTNSSIKKYSGTGLGLSISKNLASLMGGHLWCTSVEGEGSVFYLSIPLIEVQIERNQSQNLKEKDQTTLISDQNKQKYKILIADDSYENRFLVKHFLANQPFELVECDNGQDAIELVKKQSFDVVLMDIQMPLVDGYDATKVIREWENSEGKNPVAIIVISANVLPEQIEKAFESGCNSHIGKPIRKKYLLETIWGHLKS